MDFEVYKDVKFEMSKILFQMHNNTFNNPKKKKQNKKLHVFCWNKIIKT